MTRDGLSPPLAGPWPTAHADAANTGAVAASGPEGTPSVRWREFVNLATEALATSGPDGPVATQRDGTLVVYDADGIVRWRRHHDGFLAAAPVVASDGAVVVGSLNGTVVAYEPDGTERWRHDTPEGLFAPHANDATPFRIEDDAVLLAHPRGRAIAYTLAEGTVRWAVDVPRRSHRPVVDDGRAFLTSGRSGGRRGGIVQARSLSDGSEQWRTETEGPIHIGPAVHEGVVYTGDIDGRLVARAAADGTERWRVRIAGDPWISTVPTVFGGRVWVGTLSAGLYGITEAGVEVHAEIDSPTTPAVGRDRLYVGSNAVGSEARYYSAGTVLALDADGDVAWQTTTRGTPQSAVHHRNGQVVYGTRDGAVESLDASDGTRAWRAFERPDRLPAPVVGPTTFYCGSRDDSVVGYSLTGAISLWGISLEGAAPGTPAVTERTVLTGSHGGDIVGTPPSEYADEPAGRLTRTPTPDPDATPTAHVDYPPVEPSWTTTAGGPIDDIGYGGGAAYLGSGTTLVSMTDDGTVRWETAVGGPVRGAPAVGDGVVYAATADGTVLALAVERGTERWRREVGATSTAPALVRSGGTATVVVGTEAAVVALEAATGSERWRTETDRVRGTPAVADGLAVAGDEAGVLRGLALPDGAERWRAETDGAIHGSPAIAGEAAYVGSRDSYLYSVALDDGSANWRLELSEWVDGSPAVAYGAVFVVDQSGALSVVVGDR